MFGQTLSRFFLATTLLTATATMLSAQFELPGAATKTKASLVSEAKTIAPNSSFSVALRLEHPEGWHSYYQNSGGIEQHLEIKWTIPEGFSAGPIQWPVPEVKDGYFGKSFVFSGSPVFLTEITAPAALEPGRTYTLKADATWQICENSCIDEKASLTVTVTGGTTLEPDPASQALIATARASQPLKSEGWTITARDVQGDVQLRIGSESPMAAVPVDFIPDQPFVKSVSSGGSILQDGNSWIVTLKRAAKDPLDNEIPQGDWVSGILTGPKPHAIPPTRIGTESGPAKSPDTKRGALPFMRFLTVLGGMLLGGLILNLMPCVFPVIGLKIMGFVQQAGADRRKVVLHGVTFALGVIVSFGVLSALLFALRLGWGYQLQNPWVVLTLMLLMFVLALNMFGVFEIGASATSVGGSLQAKQGLAGSFFSGVLATVVATPCSAPFLGAAIGAAIALPAVQFFTAFQFMAIGLSLPYLVLSMFPKLIDLLPRPGPWMESFKQAMSFLLFATAGYLLWVYAGLIDLDNLLGPVFGLTSIAIACWIHGRWNLPHRSGNTRLAALALTALFAAAGFLMTKPPKPAALVWQPWSQETQDSLLKDGKPVYIDFTAKWCATCQFNKKRAYTGDVIALMHKKGVVALKGDKTKPSEEIDAQLRKYGRAAIPVNVLLAPGKDPIVLPEFLSPGDVLSALGTLENR